MRKLCECGIRILITAAVGTLGLLCPAAIAQSVFNCPSFSSSGSCGFANGWHSGQKFQSNGGTLSGSVINFVPAGATHGGLGFYYSNMVNVQAFTTTFTFVPNGYDLAFVIQNDSTQGPEGPTMSSGAGGEAGFSQMAGGSNIAPNNVFALELDSYSPLTNEGPFSYSSAQIYQTLQTPCLPVPGCVGGGGLAAFPLNKVSTSPVSLTTGSGGSTTGDIYSATVAYSGNTLTLSMYNVTAGGSCPGASCFTNTWHGVYIPAIVGGATAYVGFTSGVGETTSIPLYVDSFSYTVNSPSAGTALTAWNAGSTANNGTAPAASPIYSLAPGTFSGTQSISLTTSTPGAYICYALSSSYPALTPQPNNNGGCNAGTLYPGPISISSSTTLYAMAGTSNAANPSALGPPSLLVAGTYTIGGTPTASTPTFSPAAGTYSSTQSVTISDATSGATIYYTTNGTAPTTSSTQYTGPIAVSSTATLQASALDRDGTNSAVESATYTINLPVVGTPTFSPAAGTYTSEQSVAIFDATSGATIFYTTNGTVPTTSSTQYTGPITVSSTEKIEAVAVDAGETRSAVASGTYTMTPVGVGVGSQMTCLPLQSVPGSPGTLQTVCTIVLNP
jgi:hypothetical protein